MTAELSVGLQRRGRTRTLMDEEKRSCCYHGLKDVNSNELGIPCVLSHSSSCSPLSPLIPFPSQNHFSCPVGPRTPLFLLPVPVQCVTSPWKKWDTS